MRDASWAVAHKEWAPTRKIDPAGEPWTPMDKFRADLKAFMEGDDEEMGYADYKEGWKKHADDKPRPGSDRPADERFGWDARQQATSKPEPGDPGSHSHPTKAHVHELPQFTKDPA